LAGIVGLLIIIAGQGEWNDAQLEEIKLLVKK
jgi:hypothetical protein